MIADDGLIKPSMYEIEEMKIRFNLEIDRLKKQNSMIDEKYNEVKSKLVASEGASELQEKEFRHLMEEVQSYKNDIQDLETQNCLLENRLKELQT